MAGRRRAVAAAAVCATTLLLGLAVAPAVAGARPQCENNPDNPTCEDPAPEPEPSEPSPDPTSAPPSPSPSPSPRPSPSPTEDCGAAEEGAVSFGDVDQDCDGTLQLSEQGDPISIRRTVELPPPDLSEEEVAELDGVGVEDRFEPTEFVPGTLVGFDEVSEQGGTIREGSLVYTPPEGFTGLDRFTFRVRGRDDLVREAEVIVAVRVHDPSSAEPSPSPSPSPTEQATISEDAAAEVLADAPLSTTDAGERWDPPWLAVLAVIAALLVATGVSWWLFLELRIQDRLRR